MPIDEELTAALPVKPGMVISGKYRIESFIAAGGMGAVLLAYHEILDKQVAIKLIRPELAHRPSVARRFLREARAAARISSDYVARVTDVELLDDETPYIVMDYLEGEDLDALMGAQGKLPFTVAVDFALQALMGLEAAHAKGVVHRDLKPANLFLERREDGSKRVKLLDFGISKVLEGEEDGLKAGVNTDSGTMLGTPRYMSPEQIADSKSCDQRTDVWAMGLILYEMLGAAYPFEGSTSGAILSSILTTKPRPLAELRPDTPPGLEAALDKSMAKSRDDRFSSAREMIRAIAPFGSKRMAALVQEHEEAIATEKTGGQPVTLASARTPEPSASTATDPTLIAKHSKSPPANPDAGADGQATKVEGARPKLDSDSPQGGAPRAGFEEPRRIVPRPASSTETSMVAESTRGGTPAWKIAAAGAVALAGIFVVHLVRSGSTDKPTVATSMPIVTTATPERIEAPAGAREAQSGPTISPLNSAAVVVAPPSATVAASAPVTGPPPTPSAPRLGSTKPAATAPPASGNPTGLIRTRD